MIYEHIKFCPICGYKFAKEDFDQNVLLHSCHKCGYRYYHNMIPTVSSIIPSSKNPKKVLAMTRNMQPHKGKLDLAGGFMNYGETVEGAIARELKEEMNLSATIERIFGIRTNNYQYQEYHYQHTTIYFLMEPIEELPNIVDREENGSVIFFDLETLKSNQDKFAFSGDVEILTEYQESLQSL